MFVLIVALAAVALAIVAPLATAGGKAGAASVTATPPASSLEASASKKKKGCAGLSGKKRQRCKAFARCRKLKGKKRKKCLARARKIKVKVRSKQRPTALRPPGFGPQTNVQVLREVPLPAPPPCAPYKRFRAIDFPAVPVVDNQWFPLTPGTQFTLEGRANRGGGALPHQVVFTVTDLVKVVNGVRSLVMWDVDTNLGILSESELAFFAQDLKGNVWNTGEYPEEYQNGVFAGAPNTWIAGQSGAVAGVHMRRAPGIPKPGSTWYVQGFAPQIAFLDCATIAEKNVRTCVPVQCYDKVLVTHETSPLDLRGGTQTKYHAHHTGIIQVGALNDPEGETLVMTKYVQLSPSEMDHARAEALKLEQRAYEVNADYRKTEPAQRLP